MFCRTLVTVLVHICVFVFSSRHFLAYGGLCTTTIVKVLNCSSTTGFSGCPLRTTCNCLPHRHPYHPTAIDLIFISKILPCQKSSINVIIQYITFWNFSPLLSIIPWQLIEIVAYITSLCLLLLRVFHGVCSLFNHSLVGGDLD